MNPLLENQERRRRIRIDEEQLKRSRRLEVQSWIALSISIAALIISVIAILK